MSPRLAFAIEVAVRAGRATLAYFQTGTSVELKSDATPVTVADRIAERLIRDKIERAYPDDAILGEEEGAQGDSPNRWVLDPIDGTKSFVCGVPLYATLLAYEEAGISDSGSRISDLRGGDGGYRPILGVCYFPALDELLYAEKGEGAFWNGRPARVSEAKTITGAAIASGSMGTMVKAGRFEGLRMLESKALAARTWSDAYGHALVATGRVAAMIDPIVARWDVSAMSVIVREAGGRFTDFEGDDALADEAISSNGHVHREVLEAFAR